jgi:hypothetical protein
VRQSCRAATRLVDIGYDFFDQSYELYGIVRVVAGDECNGLAIGEEES